VALGRRSERNAPKNGGPKIGFLHYNAPAHQSTLVKDFLAKKNMTTLDLPTHFPDLAAADFYLFPGQKSTLKVRRFCDASSMIENATEELKRLSKDGFQEC
jgi:hypothetical protein